MTEYGSDVGKEPIGRWRRSLKVVAFVIAYMLPLFRLWSTTGYPDSLGVHVSAHGRTGLLESWYYSYLLLNRHRPLDVVLFLYMWATVAGVAAWIAWAAIKRRTLRDCP